jgi:ABC-type Fe3+ transport system permease subunit
MFIALILIAIFNRPGLGLVYGTAAMVVFACTIRYLALAWTAVRRGMEAADIGLTDAARLEGAHGWGLFRLAQWPQVARQASFGWYLVYVLCLWEVETLILVLPPGGETLAVRIFNMLHYGHTGQVNALCLVLLTLAFVPLLLIRQLPVRPTTRG